LPFFAALAFGATFATGRQNARPHLRRQIPALPPAFDFLTRSAASFASSRLLLLACDRLLGVAERDCLLAGLRRDTSEIIGGIEAGA